MERLTGYHFDGSGAYMVCSGACIDDEFDCNCCSKLKEIVDRLAAYEDTGLEPKQAMLISNVLREVGETYNCWFDYVVNCVLENSHLKDLARAEKDGRLVVLPPNAPLTLEELREMDEEPVWNDTMKKWVLVDLTWEYGERTVDADGKWRDLGDRYYRRRPEEGTA